MPPPVSALIRTLMMSPRWPPPTPSGSNSGTPSATNIFYTEHMSLVEGLLQRRIAVRLTDVENAVATPGRMPDDIPDRWQNDFSGLGAGGRDVLTKLLGTEPMALPETRAVGD